MSEPNIPPVGGASDLEPFAPVPEEGKDEEPLGAQEEEGEEEAPTVPIEDQSEEAPTLQLDQQQEEDSEEKTPVEIAQSASEGESPAVLRLSRRPRMTSSGHLHSTNWSGAPAVAAQLRRASRSARIPRPMNTP